MIIAHMKSGKSHKLDMDFPTFEELNSDITFDAIAAQDLLKEKIMHILPKENIESIEIVWDGTLAELKEEAEKHDLYVGTK
jgi:hypothetical protein